MSFGQEMKDFVEGFKAGEAIKESRSRRKLQSAEYENKRPFTEEEIAARDNPLAGGNAPAIPETTGGAKVSDGKVDNDTAQVAGRLKYDLKRDFGLNDIEAGGIVASLAAESGGFKQLQELAPTIPGSQGGWGYAQWTGPRRVQFAHWAQDHGFDPKSYEANYGFLRHELQGPEGKILGQLKGAKDIRQATQIFTGSADSKSGFLRPGKPNMAGRFNWADRIAGIEPLEWKDGAAVKTAAKPAAEQPKTTADTTVIPLEDEAETDEASYSPPAGIDVEQVDIAPVEFAAIAPEDEWQQRPQAMFAQSGGAIPEVQHFQDGGQPVNPSGTPDKYNRFRAYTQQIPTGGTTATTGTASWTPRRVGQAAPGSTSPQPMQMVDGMSPTQLAYKQAQDKLAADRAAKAAAAAAAAAKPAAAAPTTRSDYSQLTGQEMFMAKMFGKFPEGFDQKAAANNQLMRAFAGGIGGVGGQGSGRSGGGRAYAEGGAVPEPEELYKRGGYVKDRDAQFQKFLKQERRPGMSDQDVRDRAAKRLSALEGRPTSSAYEEGYWKKAKPKKGKVDKIKTGSTDKDVPTPTPRPDPTTTGSTGDAWSRAVGQTPNPYDTSTDTPPAPGRLSDEYSRPEIPQPPSTGYTYPEEMGGAGQAAVDAAPVIPEPGASNIDPKTGRRIPRFVPPTNRNPRSGTGGAPEQPNEMGAPLEIPSRNPNAPTREPPPRARAPVGHPDDAPMRTDAQQAIDVAPGPQVGGGRPVYRDPSGVLRYLDTGETVPAAGWGFAAGGAIPDEGEVMTRSPRAAEAGYTTSATGARSSARPAARPAPEPEVDRTTTSSIPLDAGQEETNRGKYKPAPNLLRDVSQAIDGGVRFLTRHFGLQGDGAMPTPESQQAQQDGSRRFASGEGATTPEELSAIDDRLDPGREMPEGDRQMVRMAKIVQWYLERGRKDDAEAAAAGLMQYGGQRVQKLGSVAAAAYQKYLQSNNPEDLQKTADLLSQAYDMIPDGGDLDVSIQDGKLVVNRTDEDGNEETIPITPDQLPGIIQGVQSKSMYWQQIMALADPEGTRQKERIKAEESEWTRRHGIEQKEELAKEERTAQREKEKYERELALKKAEEKEKAAAELAKEGRANKENERRTLRDAAIRRAEKLAETNKEINWSAVDPLIVAAADAVNAEDADSEEGLKRIAETQSRLWDALPEKSRLKDFADLGYDRGSLKYVSATADANLPKQAADGKWYRPDPARPGKYIETTPPAGS